MAGYSGYSKSNNAIDAEQAGKYPASVAAKKLGVSTQAIKEVLAPSEWHHTSKHYNKTDYYDISVDDETMAVLKAFKPVKATTSQYRADVKWLEWSGTRNYPKATEHSYKDILVTEKGQFYTFHLPSGDVRKKIGSNGTVVIKKERDC